MGLLQFFICIDFQCGGLVLRCIYFLRIYATRWWHKRIPTKFYVLPNGGADGSLGTSTGLDLSMMNLSLHWGPKDPSGFQSSLYVCPYVSLSLYPVDDVAFWKSKRAARNCAQRMCLQAMGSKPLSDSIICPSVRPSGFPRDF